MIHTKLIPQNIEIGLSEIERMIHGMNALILRIQKTKKHWRVVYKTN